MWRRLVWCRFTDICRQQQTEYTECINRLFLQGFGIFQHESTAFLFKKAGIFIVRGNENLNATNFRERSKKNCNGARNQEFVPSD
jgi:hypothetical protein